MSPAIQPIPWNRTSQLRSLIEIHLQTEDLKRFRKLFSDLIAAEAAAAPDALDPVLRAEFVVFARMTFERFDFLPESGFNIHIERRLERDIGTAGGRDRFIKKDRVFPPRCRDRRLGHPFMSLVGIEGMVRKNDIRIISGVHHVGAKRDILRLKVEDLDIGDPERAQRAGPLDHGDFIRALDIPFLVGIAGFAHDEHLDFMPGFDGLGQRAPAGDLDIVQVGPDRKYLHRFTSFYNRRKQRAGL